MINDDNKNNDSVKQKSWILNLNKIIIIDYI